MSVDLHKLMDEVAKLGAERDVTIAQMEKLGPRAEAYRRVCVTLGIEKNILGHVKGIKEQRDKLLAACKAAEGLIGPLAEELRRGARVTNASGTKGLDVPYWQTCQIIATQLQAAIAAAKPNEV
jgi:hypothetical protein